MFNISDFLQKFSKNILAQESQTKKICEIVEKQTGIVLDSKNIKIQNGVLYLQISPAEKSKIFIKKSTILKETVDLNPKILDIR
jgi:hypothetical protein